MLHLKKTFLIMDAFNSKLREDVDSAVKSTIDINQEIELDCTLLDLYQKRKKMLNLTDRQIQIILGMDKKTLMPILDGTARPYTRDVENGLTKVVKALFNVGVTVIFQPTVDNLQVRGATISINNKPCIVLSDFQEELSHPLVCAFT